MEASKNILTNTYSYVDISIIRFLFLNNFKKSLFILSFLLTFIGFSQTSNIHISQNTQLIGLDQLYIDKTEAITKETLQIKNINNSGTIFVHSTTLLYVQNDVKINILHIDSKNKTKKSHKNKETKNFVVTPKKTTNTEVVLVANENSNSGSIGISADFTPIIPANNYKKSNTASTVVAIYHVPICKTLKKEQQAISYQKNKRSYSLPIQYCNRPPPC